VVNQNSHTYIHSPPLTAFPSAPILSADEEFLYLVGAGASVLCVATSDGSVEWSFVTDGLSAAEPVLSEIEGEDPVLYTIETLTGFVRQFDAASGDVNWELDCSVTETCGSNVEADFG
jgi:outer membrane protein assembly factor BamB